MEAVKIDLSLLRCPQPSQQSQSNTASDTLFDMDWNFRLKISCLSCSPWNLAWGLITKTSDRTSNGKPYYDSHWDETPRNCQISSYGRQRKWSLFSRTKTETTIRRMLFTTARAAAKLTMSVASYPPQATPLGHFRGKINEQICWVMVNEVCVTWWWLIRQGQKLEWGHWERWRKRNGRKRVTCRKSMCVDQQLLPCGPEAVTWVPRDIFCMQISHHGTLRKNSACSKMAEERSSFGRFSCSLEYFHYKIKNSSICCN